MSDEPASGEHRTLLAMDKNDDRFEIRLPKAEKQAILAGAQEAGQNPSVFARRVLAAALSEAKGAPIAIQAGPAPVPSTSRMGCNVREPESVRDGVRPAASPRASNFDRLQGASAGEDPREGPARPRRANVGPKPASASKPRPKAGRKTKAKP